MTSTRIKGNKKLTLSFGGIDYSCDATRIELLNEEADSDVTTFCDAADGGTRQWYFEIEAIQSTDSSSFWRYLWGSTGEEVDYTYMPHGNEDATVDQPHFTGTVKIGAKPSVGGEAGQTYVFETRLDCTAEPTLVEGIDEGSP